MEGTTSGKNLIIPPGILKPGTNYSVTLSVQTISGIGAVGLAQAYFTVNLPPTGGLLTVSPSSGVFLSTLFNLTFVNWQDPDSVSPVSYTVALPLCTNKGYLLRAPFSHSIYLWVHLQAWVQVRNSRIVLFSTDLTSTTTVLPMLSNSSMLTIYASIKDGISYHKSTNICFI